VYGRTFKSDLGPTAGAKSGSHDTYADQPWNAILPVGGGNAKHRLATLHLTEMRKRYVAVLICHVRTTLRAAAL
jgi:hypothetical protein